MKRRSFLTAALLAPLIAKLAATEDAMLDFVTRPTTPPATNFGALTQAQLTAWSRDFWLEARRRTFVSAMENLDAVGTVRFPVLDFAADTTKIE